MKDDGPRPFGNSNRLSQSTELSLNANVTLAPIGCGVPREAVDRPPRSRAAPASPGIDHIVDTVMDDQTNKGIFNKLFDTRDEANAVVRELDKEDAATKLEN